MLQEQIHSDGWAVFQRTLPIPWSSYWGIPNKKISWNFSSEELQGSPEHNLKTPAAAQNLVTILGSCSICTVWRTFCHSYKNLFWISSKFCRCFSCKVFKKEGEGGIPSLLQISASGNILVPDLPSRSDLWAPFSLIQNRIWLAGQFPSTQKIKTSS